MENFSLAKFFIFVANQLPNIADRDKSVDHPAAVGIAHILECQEALFLGFLDRFPLGLDDEDEFRAFGSTGIEVRDHKFLEATCIAVWGDDFFLPTEVELSLGFSAEGGENGDDDRVDHIVNISLFMIVTVTWVTFS